MASAHETAPDLGGGIFNSPDSGSRQALLQRRLRQLAQPPIAVTQARHHPGQLPEAVGSREARRQEPQERTSIRDSTGSGTGSGQTGQTFGGAGIIGFSPASPKQSILVYKKKNHYNEWEFTYDPLSDMQTVSGGNTGTVGQPASSTSSPAGSPQLLARVRAPPHARLRPLADSLPQQCRALVSRPARLMPKHKRPALRGRALSS